MEVGKSIKGAVENKLEAVREKMAQPKIKLTVTQLKKELKSRSNQELIDIITGVFKFNKEAQIYMPLAY